MGDFFYFVVAISIQNKKPISFIHSLIIASLQNKIK